MKNSKQFCKKVGITDFSIVNDYEFQDLISKTGICKPPIKILSKKRLNKKLGIK